MRAALINAATGEVANVIEIGGTHERVLSITGADGQPIVATADIAPADYAPPAGYAVRFLAPGEQCSAGWTWNGARYVEPPDGGGQGDIT